MTAIQDWASSMCVLGIGCALLKMLCPSGAIRRVFGVLTAVMFVCCLLSPITGLLDGVRELFSISRTASPSTELSDTVEEQAVFVIEEALLHDARERLVDTANVHAVAVKRDTSRRDSIYIQRVTVTVTCVEGKTYAAVRRVLQEAWGLEVEVNGYE